MSDTEMVIVTAPNSKTSKHLVTLLEKHDLRFRGASRCSIMTLDWNDEATWEQTLNAATAISLVIPPNLALTDFSSRLESFFSVASRYSLQKVVLLSGRGEVGSRKCERIVLDSNIPGTVIRSSWFNQNFSEGFFFDGIQNGEILVPVRGIKEPFVDTRDIAEIAFNALTKHGHEEQL